MAGWDHLQAAARQGHRALVVLLAVSCAAPGPPPAAIGVGARPADEVLAPPPPTSSPLASIRRPADAIKPEGPAPPTERAEPLAPDAPSAGPPPGRRDAAAGRGVLPPVAGAVAIAAPVVGVEASRAAAPEPRTLPRPVPNSSSRPTREFAVQDASIALAAPEGAPPLVTAPALATLVQHHLADQRGVFGVAIKALGGGQGVLVNADRAFPTASLFKLPVMYEVFRQREAGELRLDDRLVLSARHAQLDLGTLDVPVGTALSIEAALRRMIVISDNASANLLADRVGWLTLNATMRELGLQETRLTGDALTTSPRDMLLLLELLAWGQGPSVASSTAMIDLLLDQRVNDRLPAQLPAGTRVAHKTGNLDSVIHDVGIVYAPGAPFIIVLLAEDAPDYGAVARAQAALTRAVYDYMLTASDGRLPAQILGPDVGALATLTPTPTPSPTVLPVPTGRVWQAPVVLPAPIPTARLWQPGPRATPAAE